MDEDHTFRLVSLHDRSLCGQTAANEELAMLVPGDLIHARSHRIGLERTDWGEHYGKPKAIRTVLVKAEAKPGEWSLGAA